jgi:hypothetical protein
MSNFTTTQSYSHAAAVTTSDTADNYGVGLFVGGSGNVSLVTEWGDTVTFTTPAVGFVIPVRFKQVRATGTTATNLVRLW